MKISVRDITRSDVDRVMDYLYRSPNGFIESIAIDPKKLAPESENRTLLLQRIREIEMGNCSQSQSLIILKDGVPVGHHSVNQITAGESAIFHAHIWRPEHRRLGIGTHSYPLACSVFMKRFALKRILFKTPIQNRGAIELKRRLGIREIGQENISFGLVRDNTPALVFELTRDESDLLVRE